MVPEEIQPTSEYGAMWLFALFDLPVDTKQAKREYVHFRKLLIREGFAQLQYSVYARYCPSDESAETYRRHVRAELPPDGQVRLLGVTDRQFGKMEVFYGEDRVPVEDAPIQLELF